MKSVSHASKQKVSAYCYGPAPFWCQMEGRMRALCDQGKG